MKWRHWSILIVLVLLNYLIFSTAFTQLAEQRHPALHPTRTPLPTFESIEPSPVAWIVLPTNTPRPTKSPVTPNPGIVMTNTAVITAAAEVPVLPTEQNTPTTAPPTSTSTPVPPTSTATPLPPTATPSVVASVHIVEAGETLSAIANRYQVSVQAIAAANGLSNPNHIVVGQRLVIPTSGQVGPTATRSPQPTRRPAPTNTPRPAVTKAPQPPTSTPTSPAASFQFTAQVIWDPLVAPNCGGPAISKESMVRDGAGNPVNGVCVEVDCYGNRWQSHPSGNPGEYDDGHYDFAFGQTQPQDWTCTVRVSELDGQPVTTSEVVSIHFDTNDCRPDGSGHQVAIVHWTRNW
jgi:LysM repeat protein